MKPRYARLLRLLSTIGILLSLRILMQHFATPATVVERWKGKCAKQDWPAVIERDRGRIGARPMPEVD
jgi:hypothetical protein